MVDAIDENTIGVVPTFGVTYTGNYEFPEPLHDALDKLQKAKGLDVDMHVDAASGGFLAPFCAPEIVWDFRLPRVKSISSSGHKYGLAPLGTGWIIWRDAAALPEELVFDVDYLGGKVGTIAINFSRPAGQVISQYYTFIRLGREGYRNVQMAAYRVAAYLAASLAPLGPYEFINTGDPKAGIPAVCFRIKEGADPGLLAARPLRPATDERLASPGVRALRRSLGRHCHADHVPARLRVGLRRAIDARFQIGPGVLR